MQMGKGVLGRFQLITMLVQLQMRLSKIFM